MSAYLTELSTDQLAPIKRTVAFHEAGHAVAATLLKVACTGASVFHGYTDEQFRRRSAFGQILDDKSQDESAQVTKTSGNIIRILSLTERRDRARTKTGYRLALVCAAGPVAEAIADNNPFPLGADGDWSLIEQIADDLGFSPARAVGFVELAIKRASLLFNQPRNWRAIEEVADSLIVGERVSPAEVESIVRRARRAARQVHHCSRRCLEY